MMPPPATTDDQGYILSRDFLASARLSFQHDLYISRLGYHLHPSIVSSLPSSQDAPPQILDLATGNGIWATDLASNLAAIGGRPLKITALDISPLQFPADSTRPDKVAFGVYDFLTDVPDEYIGRFDIIHVRFIMAALFDPRTRDPSFTSGAALSSKRDTAIQNMHRMLRPGGWLQWQENVQPAFGAVDARSEELAISGEWDPALEVMDRYLSVRAQSAWVSEIERAVEEVGGFVDAKMYFPGARRDKLSREGHLLCWNLAEALPRLVKMLDDEAGKEVSEAVEKLMGEIASGDKVMAGRVVVCVGRKV